MKLYTNESNPQALKVVLSALAVNRNFTCEAVPTNDKRFQAPRKLPVLQLECGTSLFSSNAASCYVFPPSTSIKVEVNEWLRWEAEKLLPLTLLIGSKTDPFTKIQDLLKELEKALGNFQYLVQDQFSVADICISATLYPLYVDNTLKSQYFSSCTRITKWLQFLFSRNEFKAAEETLKLKRDASLFVSLTNSCWFPTILNKNASKSSAPGVDVNHTKDTAANDTCSAAVNLQGGDYLTSASLENAIAAQGDLVRSLKAAKKSKEELKPHIDKLLNLKKQLSEFKEVSSTPSPASLEKSGQKTSEDLQAQITAQGDLVRSLKAAKKSKDELKPHINKLLNLKKQLSELEAAKSSPPPAPVDKSGQKKPPQDLQDQNATQAQDKLLSEEDIAEALASWEQGVKSRLVLKPLQKPVLPKDGEDNILITSALPYVNNVPHLGNIIGCVLSADVFARYCRARGLNTLYICGTDEYGTATENKALEEGLTPQEICDKYFAIHKDIYEWFNIGFDQFGRTTTPEQTEIVQDLFLQVHRNGYTLIDSVDQLLCEKCDRYLADRFVEGICPNCKYEDARGDQCDGCGHLINAVELIQPRCKQCQSTPVVKQSKQIFLDLPKLQTKLEEWTESTTDEWSNIAKVITKAWLKEGLKPRCITRDLKWGVKVPLEGFEGKVFYVWFDAPIGYMSITKGYTDKWLQWWKPSSEKKVTLYQFMAKDNVPFHSIMFPSTLHACNQGYTIVERLFATEYLNYENGKFSKSRGIGVFGNDARETGIPSDIFRFYLLFLRPETQDSNFCWVDFASKNNFELLNNLGNFILRSLSFTEKFFNSQVPPVVLGSEEKELVARASVELKSYVQALKHGRLRDGIKYILNISRHGNIYMQSTQPWVLVKGSNEQKDKASSAIGLLCNVVCLVASLLQPYMPSTVETIAKQVNVDTSVLSIMDKFQPYLKPGHKIGKPTPLFTKIEPAVVESLKQKYAGRQKSTSPEKITPTVPSKLNLQGVDQLTALVALENAISAQGDLVRSLKAAKESKDVLKPQIDTLLDLKKQLAEFKATNSTASLEKSRAPQDQTQNGKVEAAGIPTEGQASQVNSSAESKGKPPRSGAKGKSKKNKNK